MSGHARQHIATVVGQNIASARGRFGWTQRDLARALDTSERMVSRWENGKHRPAPAYEVEIVRVLFGGDALALYREPSPPLEAA